MKGSSSRAQRALCAYLQLAIVVVGSAALPLRADAPQGHYTLKDGTVRDTSTQLTWQQTIDANKRAWTDSVTYCAQLELAGSGWRLPTLKELLTLVDLARTTPPAIDLTAFPGTPADLFWTSNSYIVDASYGWSIDFRKGSSAKDHAKSTGAYTRCVR